MTRQAWHGNQRRRWTSALSSGSIHKGSPASECWQLFWPTCCYNKGSSQPKKNENVASLASVFSFHFTREKAHCQLVLGKSDWKMMGSLGLSPPFCTSTPLWYPNSSFKHCLFPDIPWSPGALWLPQFPMDSTPIARALCLPHPLLVLCPIPSYLGHGNTNLLLKNQPRLSISFFFFNTRPWTSDNSTHLFIA